MKLDELVGKVTHFYDKISVAIIKLDKDMKVGDAIKIKGGTSDVALTVEEMQFDHKALESASTGQEIGIKVPEKVREGDKVYLVKE